jgi:hypothetical protein
MKILPFNGERIAQLVIAKHERAEWSVVQELSETQEVKVVLVVEEIKALPRIDNTNRTI